MATVKQKYTAPDLLECLKCSKVVLQLKDSKLTEDGSSFIAGEVAQVIDSSCGMYRTITYEYDENSVTVPLKDDCDIIGACCADVCVSAILAWLGKTAIDPSEPAIDTSILVCSEADPDDDSVSLFHLNTETSTLFTKCGDQYFAFAGSDGPVDNEVCDSIIDCVAEDLQKGCGSAECCVLPQYTGVWAIDSIVIGTPPALTNIDLSAATGTDLASGIAALNADPNLPGGWSFVDQGGQLGIKKPATDVIHEVLINASVIAGDTLTCTPGNPGSALCSILKTCIFHDLGVQADEPAAVGAAACGDGIYKWGDGSGCDAFFVKCGNSTKCIATPPKYFPLIQLFKDEFTNLGGVNFDQTRTIDISQYKQCSDHNAAIVHFKSLSSGPGADGANAEARLTEVGVTNQIVTHYVSNDAKTDARDSAVMVVPTVDGSNIVIRSLLFKDSGTGVETTVQNIVDIIGTTKVTL